MVKIIITLLGLTCLLVHGEEQTKKSVNSITDSYLVELVSVVRSRNASKHLEARFKCISENSKHKGRIIKVSFPAHSFTPKEQKIISLLSSFYNKKVDQDGSPLAKVVYSIPSKQIINPPTLWKYEIKPFEEWLLKEPKRNAEQDISPNSVPSK